MTIFAGLPRSGTTMFRMLLFVTNAFAMNETVKVETLECRFPCVDLRLLAQGLRRISAQVNNFYPDFDADL